MNSVPWNQRSQVTFPRSHSSGTTRAHTQRGQAPRAAGLEEDGLRKARVAASDEAREMDPATDLSLRGPPSSASGCPAASGCHPPPGQPLGLFIKLHFIIVTPPPPWLSGLPGKGTAWRGAMAPWPLATSPPDLQVGLWTRAMSVLSHETRLCSLGERMGFRQSSTSPARE